MEFNFPLLADRLPFALFMIPARYFFFAGIFYVVFYVVKKKAWSHLKIQEKIPPRKIMRMEVFYSTMTMLIFSVFAALIFMMIAAGMTKFYVDIHMYGVPYFIFTLVAILFIHDFYFFVTHYMMHHKKLYPIIHQIHHVSLNPTPWAAFSFHPIEAVIQIAWLPVLIAVMPLHPFVIFWWAIYMMLFNVIGHLGYEIFSMGYMRGFGKFFFSSTFHNMHHSKNNCNFGLYFVIWDRFFGTVHSAYESTYNQIKGAQSVPE